MKGLQTRNDSTFDENYVTFFTTSMNDSLGKILLCDHSNEASFAAPFMLYYFLFNNLPNKFSILVRFGIWLLLGVKGLKQFSRMQVHCRAETFKSELCIHFHGVHQQHTQSSCQVQFHIHLLTMFIKKVSVVPRMDSSPKVEV